MRFLKSLVFGSGAGSSHVGQKVTLQALGNTIARIAELDVIGEQVRSPNGRFTLVLARDHSPTALADRCGRFVLVEAGVIRVNERMARPQHGKIANNGTFILNDWGSRAGLEGVFHAFRADGGEIVRRNYSANLYNNGLSADGRLATCQTCKAPDSPDSSILSVFDLQAGSIIAEWTPESGWANAYEFPQGRDRVRMLRPDRVPLDYTLHGDFLDGKLWLQDEVSRGALYGIRQALAEGEATSGVSLDELRRAAERAIADDDTRFQAEAYRLLGEIEEAPGDREAALAAYDCALVANPKVGVAKRVATLRKALSSQAS